MAAIATMLLERGLYSSQPPALQTKADMNPTLLVSWWCTGFAMVAILIRVAGRFVRTEKLFQEDKIMFYSIIPLLIRMGLVHVVLIWGTNNTVTTGLTPIEIRHREIGSKLVLASRIFYAAFIWIAKFSLVGFLKRLIGASWHKSYEIGMRAFDVFLITTFLAVVISTLAECQPFSHYWQVVPDPGPHCREGLAQLITMGVCDILTDLSLIIAPIPLVIMSSMPVKRKISLVLLFLLSTILIAITSYRMPATISRHSAQQFRSLLASLEILAASGVTNAVVIGSFIRDRGMKKAKFRAYSVADDSLAQAPTRKKSIAQHHWGSDEDLVRELGMSCAPSLQHHNTMVDIPRVAPVALPNHNAPANIPNDHAGESSVDRTWNFKKASRQRRSSNDSLNSSYTDVKLDVLESHAPDEPISPSSGQRDAPGMSFFDVGGLVDSSTPPNVSRDSSVKDHTTSGTLQPSRPSARAFLSDVGGMLSSRPVEGDSVRQIVPGSIHRKFSTQQHRFNRGGAAYNTNLSIAEHEEAMSSSRTGVKSTQEPSQDDGPDTLGFSDAGGLLS
jgi:hypothetical protein